MVGVDHAHLVDAVEGVLEPAGERRPLAAVPAQVRGVQLEDAAGQLVLEVAHRHREPTRDELAGRLEDSALMILDVRSEEEFRGKHGYPCDPRQGRTPSCSPPALTR